MCLHRTQVIHFLHIPAAGCKYCLNNTIPLCNVNARYAASSSFPAEFTVHRNAVHRVC